MILEEVVATETRPRRVICVTGDSATAACSDRHDLSVIRFSDLGAEVAASARPEIVICRLFSAGLDVLDVAAVLQAAGYRGILRALSDPLPRPELIKAEVKAIAPNLDFDVITLEMALTLH